MSTTSLRLWVSAFEPEQFPKPILPEVVFVGRSNVGKSLLINRLTGVSPRRNAGGGARVSSHPGCTRAVHFYHWGTRAVLVDLPGFGYAKLSKSQRRGLGRLVEAYFTKPRRRVLLHLIDARLPLQAIDQEMLAWGRDYADFYLLLMNKCDKLSRSALEKQRRQFTKALAGEGDRQPELLEVSALTGAGLPALLTRIRDVLEKLD